MARMRAEADHLAADGIVGVQLRIQMYASARIAWIGPPTAPVTWPAMARTGRLTAVRSPPLSTQDSSGCWRRARCGRLRARHLRVHVAHQGVMRSAGQAARRPGCCRSPGRLRGPWLALTRCRPRRRAAQSSGVVGVTVEVGPRLGRARGPSSWPPARRSSGSPISTGCRKPAQADVHARPGRSRISAIPKTLFRVRGVAEILQMRVFTVPSVLSPAFLDLSLGDPPRSKHDVRGHSLAGAGVEQPCDGLVALRRLLRRPGAGSSTGRCSWSSEYIDTRSYIAAAEATEDAATGWQPPHDPARWMS